MRKSNQSALRVLLRGYEDGLTVSQMAAFTDAPQNSVQQSLKCMPDAYIDRWKTSGSNRYLSAVWCVVVPPENCPKPERKKP
jgi:hypothetical protein